MDIEKRVEELENTLAKVVNCQDTLAMQIATIIKMLDNFQLILRSN